MSEANRRDIDERLERVRVECAKDTESLRRILERKRIRRFERRREELLREMRAEAAKVRAYIHGQAAG